MKEKLTRALELQEELDKIVTELQPLLRKYTDSRHFILSYNHSIEVWPDTVSFTGLDGDGDEFLKVSWAYFDNPDEYIRNETKVREAKEQQLKKVIADEKERQDRLKYEELKKKFEILVAPRHEN